MTFAYQEVPATLVSYAQENAPLHVTQSRKSSVRVNQKLQDAQVQMCAMPKQEMLMANFALTAPILTVAQ